MFENGVEIEKVLKDKLDICFKLRLTLKDIINNRRGSVWAIEQVNDISRYIDSIKRLDESLIGIERCNFNLSLKTKILSYLVNIEKTMLEIKHLLYLFQTRLTGGKELVSKEIKNILNGMEIKSYLHYSRVVPSTEVCL